MHHGYPQLSSLNSHLAHVLLSSKIHFIPGFPSVLSNVQHPPLSQICPKGRRGASTCMMQHWAGKYWLFAILLLPLCLLLLQLVWLERGRKYHLAAYRPCVPSYLDSHDGKLRTQNNKDPSVFSKEGDLSKAESPTFIGTANSAGVGLANFGLSIHF